MKRGEFSFGKLHDIWENGYFKIRIEYFLGKEPKRKGFSWFFMKNGFFFFQWEKYKFTNFKKKKFGKVRKTLINKTVKKLNFKIKDLLNIAFFRTKGFQNSFGRKSLKTYIEVIKK